MATVYCLIIKLLTYGKLCFTLPSIQKTDKRRQGKSMSVEKTTIAPGLEESKITIFNNDVFTIFEQGKPDPADPESWPLVAKATLEPDQTRTAAGSLREGWLSLEFKPYGQAEQFIASSMLKTIGQHNQWNTHLDVRHEHDGLTGIVSARRDSCNALLKAFEIAALPVQTERGIVRRPAISAPMMKALRKELGLD